jgi:hypothetical protein
MAGESGGTVGCDSGGEGVGDCCCEAAGGSCIEDLMSLLTPLSAPAFPVALSPMLKIFLRSGFATMAIETMDTLL